MSDIVWQIAMRDYKFGKGKHKSLTKATYTAIGDHFRGLWGNEAGWAHSVGKSCMGLLCISTNPGTELGVVHRRLKALCGKRGESRGSCHFSDKG